MDELREKCPWDRKQTFETPCAATRSRRHELDAILDRNMGHPRGAGRPDAAYRLSLKSQPKPERSDYADVVDGLCDKLIYRHPHAHGDIHADTPDDVKRNWEALKLRKKNRRSGTPGGVPVSSSAAGDGQGDWERREDVSSESP